MYLPVLQYSKSAAGATCIFVKSRGLWAVGRVPPVRPWDVKEGGAECGYVDKTGRGSARAGGAWGRCAQFARLRP